MFEKFVHKKIVYESDIVRNLSEISREKIVKSNLSEFTKNFILSGFSGKRDVNTVLTMVEKSNKLYFNFAIRPKWTLVTFLFNNFESRPQKEILKKLDTFPFYKFYTDSISDFINDNFHIFTTKNEITALIDDTDKAIYKKLTNEITNQKIKNFFLQLFRLRYDDESNYNLESTIPYSFIKIFLTDKNYIDLEKKFHKISNLNDELEISLKDIIKVLTDKFSNEPNEEQKSEKKEPLKIKILPERKIVVEDKTEPTAIYSEDLVKAAEEEVVLDAIRLPDNKVKNIKELFSDRLTQRILDKVYGSDVIYKEKSFEKLSNYKTWFEVTNHLKEIFQINRVDIYNKDVMKFVEVLNGYFKRME